MNKVLEKPELVIQLVFVVQYIKDNTNIHFLKSQYIVYSDQWIVMFGFINK